MEMEGKQINLSFADNYNNCLYNINTEQELIHEYLLILSTCHECVVDNSNKNSCSNYQGPSPDEIALLDAAREMGYSFVERSQNTITIMYKEERLTFELYKLFEFNSDRKRMSIIIKHNDVIKILIKGADNIILQRLNKKVNQPFLKHVIQKLEEFSINGFRTLCIAMKIISEENLKEFLEKMENAQNDTEKSRYK